MITRTDSRNKLESFICHNESARIICPQIINLFRECELPEFSANEFHGVQLSLELVLNIPNQQIDDLASEILSNNLYLKVNILNT